MNLELNSKTRNNYKGLLKITLKCIVFALCSCIVSMLCHIINAAFIENVHGKPEFVSNILFAYSIGEKILFAIGYLVLGYKIPIKNTILRAFTYIMLIWASNFIPQIMGLAGADGPIAASAFSVAIVVCDSITYLVSGVLLGILFRNVPERNIRSCKRSRYIKTIITSAIGFPLLVIIVDQLMEKIYAPFSSVTAMGVSDGRQMTFYMNFYSWFIVSGVLIAVFYRVTEYNEESDRGWLKFAMKYAILIWSPVVLIMIVFGTAVLPTVAYTMIFAICILIISWVDGKMLGSVQNI